jgi:hypothetical protein
MVALPVVVLGLQPGGLISEKTAREYAGECRSPHKYQILCCECLEPLPEDKREIFDIAHLRALEAMSLFPEAQVAIGLHSCVKRLTTRQSILQVRLVSAVLVSRDDPGNPLVLVTSQNTTRAAAREVIKLMDMWGIRRSTKSTKPLIRKFA